MMTFDKYPLCSTNKEDATDGTQAPEEKKRPANNQTTVKKDDENDIDAIDKKDSVQHSKVENKKENSDDPQEPTRGKMASVFISGFFMIIMILNI